MHLDHVAVIRQSRQFEVEGRVPLINPLGQRDPRRARIDVGVATDGGFLVPAVVLGGLAGLEMGLDCNVPSGPRQRARQRFPRFSA
jgi:hypothetical protein